MKIVSGKCLWEIAYAAWVNIQRLLKSRCFRYTFAFITESIYVSDNSLLAISVKVACQEFE